MVACLEAGFAVFSVQPHTADLVKYLMRSYNHSFEYHLSFRSKYQTITLKPNHAERRNVCSAQTAKRQQFMMYTPNRMEKYLSALSMKVMQTVIQRPDL